MGFKAEVLSFSSRCCFFRSLAMSASPVALLLNDDDLVLENPNFLILFPNC